MSFELENLTACKKKIRPVIKAGFLDETVRHPAGCSFPSLDLSGCSGTRFCEGCTFGNHSLYSARINRFYSNKYVL